MEYPNVHTLAKRYGPPKVDLQDAEILDSYGSEAHAQLPIMHHVPEDVTREQLDYYGWIYPFVEDTDLIFYLYPIAREYATDLSLDCIDSFLYTLEWRLERLLPTLTEEDEAALREGLLWIWDVGGTDYADWERCPTLQEFVGLK